MNVTPTRYYEISLAIASCRLLYGLRRRVTHVSPLALSPARAFVLSTRVALPSALPLHAFGALASLLPHALGALVTPPSGIFPHAHTNLFTTPRALSPRILASASHAMRAVSRKHYKATGSV